MKKSVNSQKEDDQLKQYSALLNLQEAWGESSILKPGKKRRRKVTEAIVVYREDFGIFLREQFEGLTVTDVAEFLEITPEQLIQMLEGRWAPTKAICKKLELKTVYAMPRRKGTTK